MLGRVRPALAREALAGLAPYAHLDAEIGGRAIDDRAHARARGRGLRAVLSGRCVRRRLAAARAPAARHRADCSPGRSRASRTAARNGGSTSTSRRFRRRRISTSCTRSRTRRDATRDRRSSRAFTSAVTSIVTSAACDSVDAEPPRGALVVLTLEGKQIGDVRSSALSPRFGAIALVMVRREVEMGSTLAVEGRERRRRQGRSCRCRSREE